MKKEELMDILEKDKKYFLIWKGEYGEMHEFTGKFSHIQTEFEGKKLDRDEFIFIDEDDEENFSASEIKKIYRIKDGLE